MQDLTALGRKLVFISVGNFKVLPLSPLGKKQKQNKKGKILHVDKIPWNETFLNVAFRNRDVQLFTWE